MTCAILCYADVNITNYALHMIQVQIVSISASRTSDMFHEARPELCHVCSITGYKPLTDHHGPQSRDGIISWHVWD
jgi:hypothetical protein